jgi:hypothetical protein
MTLPGTTADVLSEHVVSEAESVDRMYLNVYQPKLQDGGGVSAFFVSHRGHMYASSVLMAPIIEAFVVSRRGLTQLLRCSRPTRLGGLRPVPCQKLAHRADLPFCAGYAALRYSLIRPPTTRLRPIRAVMSMAWPD